MTNERLINKMIDEFDFTNSSDEELEKFFNDVCDLAVANIKNDIDDKLSSCESLSKIL